MIFGGIIRQNGNGRSHKFHSPMSTGNNGFTSFASFSTMSSNGRPSGSGAIKRTSTSTSYVNGKKIMTKK